MGFYSERVFPYLLDWGCPALLLASIARKRWKL